MNQTLKPSSLQVALNRIDYAPSQLVFGISSNVLNHDRYEGMSDTSNISKDSKAWHSNFFQESANQIIRVITALSPEQRRIVLFEGVDVLEMMKAIEFESVLQSSLSEKPITTRKSKI